MKISGRLLLCWRSRRPALAPIFFQGRKPIVRWGGPYCGHVLPL